MKTKKLGVGIIIENHLGEYLLHLRDGCTSIMANQWSLIGGGVEAGEDPKKAAERELFEETSLHVTSIEKVARIVFNDEWDAIIYCANVNTNANTPISREGGKLQFFTITELRRLLNKLDNTNPFLEFLKRYKKL